VYLISTITVQGIQDMMVITANFKMVIVKVHSELVAKELVAGEKKAIKVIATFQIVVLDTVIKQRSFRDLNAVEKRMMHLVLVKFLALALLMQIGLKSPPMNAMVPVPTAHALMTAMEHPNAVIMENVLLASGPKAVVNALASV